MEWIDIKSLPTNDNNNGDKYNCVLVYSQENRAVAFAQYIFETDQNGYWNLLSDGIFSDVGVVGIDCEKITHWMPFPNQPERSKREDSQLCEMRCSEHCGNTVRDK